MFVICLLLKDRCQKVLCRFKSHNFATSLLRSMTMVLKLDGISEIGPHVQREISISYLFEAFDCINTSRKFDIYFKKKT